MKAESWRQKDVWKLGLGRRFVFQHSNNQNIHGEEWPPEDHSERSWLALNPTKNLWDELKIKIKAEQKFGGAWERGGIVEETCETYGKLTTIRGG